MIHCEPRTCVGCRMCEVACSSFHFGAVSPALSRIRVAKLEEIGVDMSISCMSCADRPCVEVCATEALEVGESGEIVLDVDLCSACELCVDECPVGAIGYRDDLPLFCDLCDGEISCVTACPSGALTFQTEFRDVPLAAVGPGAGNANLRRTTYVAAQTVSLREDWVSGVRIDA